MARIITIANQKGGVGKTVTAHNLAAGLAHRGKRVLTVDIDSQCSLTWLLTATAPATGTVLDVLLGHLPPSGLAVGTTVDGLKLWPGSPDLAGLDAVLTAPGREYRLKEALAGVAGNYDYVIIDTPPALSVATLNALAASNAVIIPATTDALSLAGIRQLMGTIGAVRTYCNPGLAIAGILLARCNLRTVIGRELAAAIGTVAADIGTSVFSSTIREAIAVRESQMRQLPISSYAPGSPAANDFDAFVSEFLAKEDHNHA